MAAFFARLAKTNALTECGCPLGGTHSAYTRQPVRDVSPRPSSASASFPIFSSEDCSNLYHLQLPFILIEYPNVRDRSCAFFSIWIEERRCPLNDEIRLYCFWYLSFARRWQFSNFDLQYRSWFVPAAIFICSAAWFLTCSSYFASAPSTPIVPLCSRPGLPFNCSKLTGLLAWMDIWWSDLERMWIIILEESCLFALWNLVIWILADLRQIILYFGYFPFCQFYFSDRLVFLLSQDSFQMKSKHWVLFYTLAISLFFFIYGQRLAETSRRSSS